MAEIDNKKGKFSYEESGKLEYLKYCFFESLRIECPMAYSGRCAFDVATTIGGVRIGVGDSVVMATDYMHHDPTQWRRPD